MRRLALVTIAALALFVPEALRGQDIGGNLQELAQDNAELYVAPVFEGLGNAMNVGVLRTPDVHNQLGFDVGVRFMAALIPDAKNTFTAIPPEQISVTFGGMTREYTDPYAPADGSLTTPTAVGEGSGVVLEPTGDFRQDLLTAGENPDDYNVPFPEGLDVPAIPFAVVQAGVGVGFGTELDIRFIPETEVDEEVGSVSAFGFGVTHQINRWIPGPTPVDLAVFGGYQSFSAGDYLDASTTTFGASVGKGLGPLSAYAVAQYESPSADLEYTVSNPGNENPALPPDGTTFAFSPEIDGGPRVGVGAQFTLLVLQFAAEYTVGDYDAVTGRVSISFR